MSVGIKSMDKVAKKWATVTPQRVGDYEDGVRNPRTSWKNATLAATKNFEAGIQAAISEKRFEAGVSKAGDSKWQRGALEKGTVRWGPGVQGAEQDYANGFAPIHAAIASATLPGRFPAGDPRNIERSRVMASIISAAARRKK